MANEIGVEWNKISDATFSPIEEVILHMFSKMSENNETLTDLMTNIGLELINTLTQFTGRWQQLSDSITTTSVNGNEIVFSLGILGDNDPSFALSAYVSERHPNAVATITHDDRGDGYCLFRLNDSPKIDFSLIPVPGRGTCDSRCRRRPPNTSPMEVRGSLAVKSSPK